MEGNVLCTQRHTHATWTRDPGAQNRKIRHWRTWASNVLVASISMPSLRPGGLNGGISTKSLALPELPP